jgi:hypothetical protein
MLAVLVAASAVSLPGCAGGDAAKEAREWSWLVATKRGLDAERDALAALPPGSDTARRAAETARRAAAYQRRLQRYLEHNEVGPEASPEAGQPLPPHELAALHMRSDEAVRAARDFVARAGDYRQAIEICRSALSLDPGYPPLERQLAAAEAGRYVTAARFAQVKPGMTAAAVRGLLGPPNLHDVRDYPQRGLVAWFYPKDATGAAAGVWFKRAAGAGSNAPGPVFQVDFDALDPRRDASPPPVPPAPAPTGSARPAVPAG